MSDIWNLASWFLTHFLVFPWLFSSVIPKVFVPPSMDPRLKHSTTSTTFSCALRASSVPLWLTKQSLSKTPKPPL